jgi:hypothetical protein
MREWSGRRVAKKPDHWHRWLLRARRYQVDLVPAMLARAP